MTPDETWRQAMEEAAHSIDGRGDTIEEQELITLMANHIRALPVPAPDSSEGLRAAYRRGVEDAVQLLLLYKVNALAERNTNVKTMNEYLDTIATDIRAHADSAKAYAECGPEELRPRAARAALAATAQVTGMQVLDLRPFVEQARQFLYPANVWPTGYSPEMAKRVGKLVDLLVLAARIPDDLLRELSEKQVIEALNATTYEPGDFAPECGSHSSTWVKRFAAALSARSEKGKL